MDTNLLSKVSIGVVWILFSYVGGGANCFDYYKMYRLNSIISFIEFSLGYYHRIQNDENIARIDRSILQSKRNIGTHNIGYNFRPHVKSMQQQLTLASTY